MWSQERIDSMLKYVSEGFSATKIAALLGKGFTRGAIIGKLDRLRKANQTTVQLGARKPPEKKPKPEKPQRPFITIRSKPVEKKPLFIAPIELVEGFEPVSLMDLRHFHCRYPVSGEGVNMLYCGATTDIKPYCEKHRKLCYRPVNTKETNG